MNKIHQRLYLFGLFIVILSLLSSCTEEEKEETIEFDLNQLVGTWENHEEDPFIEKWEKSTEGLAGMGHGIVDGEPHNIEILSIDRQDGQLIYGADVSNQNGRIIYFKCVKESTNMLTFENPEHDFPQRIVYEIKSPNKMEVIIELLDGSQAIPFNFTKKE